MRIVFATNNRHKLEEVSAILGEGFELMTPADCGITEDIPETADTLEGNALQKARYVYERIRDADLCTNNSAVAAATFADDTGLEVTALGGAPGVYSARYAAMGDADFCVAKSAVGVPTADFCVAKSAVGVPTFEANNRLLLKNMEGVEDRSARFRTVIALIIGGEEHLFEGRVEGRIIDEYRGSGGFGYDPIFVPDIQGEHPSCVAESAAGVPTFAEMSAEEKNAISHRGRAVEKLRDFLNRL